jgi:hypothetical protein
MCSLILERFDGRGNGCIIRHIGMNANSIKGKVVTGSDSNYDGT